MFVCLFLDLFPVSLVCFFVCVCYGVFVLGLSIGGCSHEPSTQEDCLCCFVIGVFVCVWCYVRLHCLEWLCCLLVLHCRTMKLGFVCVKALGLNTGIGSRSILNAFAHSVF